MKQYIKEFTILLILLLIIFLGMNEFQKKYNNNSGHYCKQYQELNNPQVNANAIIIGTSHTLHAIIPSYLNNNINKNRNKKDNLIFYNFAFNGANPKFYNQWYNEIFANQYNKPKLIIMGVDWFIFERKWLWRDLELDSEYFTNKTFYDFWINNKNSIRDFDRINLIVNKFPFLKYRQDLQYSIKFQVGNPDFQNNFFDNGYVPFNKIMNEESSKPTSIKTTIDKKQLIYFTNLIKQFTSQNIKIVFVSTPEYNISLDFYVNLESLRLVKNIAQINNIEFLNYNNELRSQINGNELLFSDWGHLNKKGSEEFTKIFAKDLNLILKNN